MAGWSSESIGGTEMRYVFDGGWASPTDPDSYSGSRSWSDGRSTVTETSSNSWYREE